MIQELKLANQMDLIFFNVYLIYVIYVVVCMEYGHVSGVMPEVQDISDVVIGD